MTATKLRQQGGAVVFSIPSGIAAKAGWSKGTLLDVTADGQAVRIKPSGRVARGRKTMAQLLEGIDEGVRSASLTKKSATGWLMPHRAARLSDGVAQSATKGRKLARQRRSH